MKENKLGRLGVEVFKRIMFPLSGEEGSVQHHAAKILTAGVAAAATVPLSLKLGENCEQLATLCGAAMIPITAAAVGATLVHSLYPVVARKVRNTIFQVM